MENVRLVFAIEVGVEVECVAVENGCFVHLVLHDQIDLLQFLNGARLEVELSLEGLVSQTLAGIICVQDGLLELFDECLIVQAAQVETVEVSCSPKFALTQLLVIDGFIRERHDAEVGLVGKHQPFWFQEHVPRNDVSLQHALVE